MPWTSPLMIRMKGAGAWARSSFRVLLADLHVPFSLERWIVTAEKIRHLSTL